MIEIGNDIEGRKKRRKKGGKKRIIMREMRIEDIDIGEGEKFRIGLKRIIEKRIIIDMKKEELGSIKRKMVNWKERKIKERKVMIFWKKIKKRGIDWRKRKRGDWEDSGGMGWKLKNEKDRIDEIGIIENKKRRKMVGKKENEGRKKSENSIDIEGEKRKIDVGNGEDGGLMD